MKKLLSVLMLLLGSSFAGAGGVGDVASLPDTTTQAADGFHGMIGVGGLSRPAYSSDETWNTSVALIATYSLSGR